MNCLNVVFSNNPFAVPTARWLRNGREIPEGARYRTEAQNDVFKLIIKEVWDIDSGEYTCEVSNVYGSDSATATLTVQGEVYTRSLMLIAEDFFSFFAVFLNAFWAVAWRLSGTERF